MSAQAGEPLFFVRQAPELKDVLSGVQAETLQRKECRKQREGDASVGRYSITGFVLQPAPDCLKGHTGRGFKQAAHQVLDNEISS